MALSVYPFSAFYYIGHLCNCAVYGVAASILKIHPFQAQKIGTRQGIRTPDGEEMLSIRNVTCVEFHSSEAPLAGPKEEAKCCTQ